ncbi:hypothetical protein DFQ26_000716 [Actinomortierella ambigua]|nr:hypothetical protein DFQ26_000716 [Actinomortierella ambigua]
MDFFASTYKNHSQGGNSDSQHHQQTRPHPRRSQSISFPHYCPQQQGYDSQSDPLLRRTSQGLGESSLSPMAEESMPVPGFSEDCQFDPATMELPRSPPRRRTSHRLRHFSTVPDLYDYHSVPEETQRDLDFDSGHAGSQRHSTYVSNPCLSHHVNTRGYGSVQRPSSLGRRSSVGGHKKSFSHQGVRVMPQSVIPTLDDCVPHPTGESVKMAKGTNNHRDEEVCRLRNSQQMLQDADATVSSKGRLFPTSQNDQHLHHYLRKLHEDVKSSAALLMANSERQGSGDGGTSSSPSPSPSNASLSPVPLDPKAKGLAVQASITRTPSPLTVRAMEKVGSNDLPDTTQDIYAAQASPAESYTLQRRISQYGYSDPTLLAKLSLQDGESEHCVRVGNGQPGKNRRPENSSSSSSSRHDQLHVSVFPAPQLDSGSRSPRSPFLDVANTAVRDRLQHSSYAVGSPTLMSPPFSPVLSGEEDSAGYEALPALPAPEVANPHFRLTRRQPSFTGFTEGPGMELYPSQASH